MKFVIISLAVAMFFANMQSAIASSSSFSKVECDVESETCDKMILEMGQQEALTVLMLGEGTLMKPTLIKAIEIYKAKNSLAGFSDAEIVEMLAVDASL